MQFKSVCCIISGELAQAAMKLACADISHTSVMGYLSCRGDYRVGNGHLHWCQSENGLAVAQPVSADVNWLSLWLSLVPLQCRHDFFRRAIFWNTVFLPSWEKTAGNVKYDKTEKLVVSFYFPCPVLSWLKQTSCERWYPEHRIWLVHIPNL